MKRKLLYGTVLTAILAIGITAWGAKRRSLRNIDTSTEDELNLERFMGLWYEIARMDHPFERGMSHVTATYSLMGDGSVEVCNEGIKTEKMRRKKSVGKAVMPDSDRPRRLRVSFFPMIYSDYNILKIDDLYTYALIGSRTSDYLWILSRTPSLPTTVYSELLLEAAKRGYDVDRLFMVDQH